MPQDDSFPDRSTPASAETPPPSSAAHSRRRFLIRFSIAATAAAFISMAGLMYYFWWKRPTGAATLIVVLADERLDGATVRIQGPPDMTRTLDEEAKYVARFMLPPGNYLIEVEHKGRTVYRQDLLRLQENIPMQFDLTKMLDAPGGKPESR